jgi:prepilin-type N-terminal cleavage/methylation domain-containing protein
MTPNVGQVSNLSSDVGQIFNLSLENVGAGPILPLTTRQIKNLSYDTRQVGNLSYDPRQIKNLPHNRGFTLLEVMLALAILVGAIVVLSELGRMGLRSAKTSRDLSRAELLCESIMSEIAVGIISPDPVQSSPIIDPVSGTTLSETQSDDVAPWVYSIESETIDEDGLLSVRLTVQQDLPLSQHPVSFTLVRWIPDPMLDLLGESTQTDSTSSPESTTE